MGARGPTRIVLCGPLAVELAGRRVEDGLPGRQGRLVLAYLATRRERPVSRDELIDALWPADPPADPDEALSALLSKVRRALGKGVLEGRRDLTLVLPAGSSIDLEDALQAAERAEAALALSDWRSAWDEAKAAREVASGGFLPGHDAPWVEDRRREVDELRLRTLECAAAAGAALGGPELAAGERAARELIEAAPFRESGYRFLMATLAARGNVAEALQVYEDLRVLLRDELGTSPGAAVKALHERLLTEGEGGPGGAPLVDPLGAQPPRRDLAEADEHPREERKLVTVLFADLGAGRGRLDPEQLRPVLAPHHARVLSELQRFGGTVDRFVGGAVLAVFGAPVAHEDDPERAVRAALRVMELARELAQGAPELEPVARAGVATGEALVSLGAEPAAGQALAQGYVVEAALGLQRAAHPGAVVVDEATARATRDAIEYQESEPVLLDGEPNPSLVWTARRVRDRPGTEPGSTPFVGRDHELALLETLQRTVLEEERPRLVAIVGEPGVGKTRLTDELIRRMEGSATVYRGRCLPYGEGITYWALREILWTAGGILLDDPGERASAKLARLVERLIDQAEDAERTTAALARTAGMALVDSPLEGMTPESVAEEVGLAWPRFLGALARERSTIIVVEDLHWAEAPLLDMLERLVSRSAGSLLIVATARPEFGERRPGWSATPGMSQIGLEPLTEAQSRELVESLLPGVSAELRDRVVAPAEGNPFFAEEIVRHLAGETWSETIGDPAAAIPNSVRALIAARIDALPEAEKLTLQDAAVVGRVFWATTLEAMAPDRSVRSALRTLEEKGLVVASPSSVLPGQLELSFRHALKREVAYRSIPRARRCLAHADVARWIEELAGDRRAEFVDLLAYHYEAAATPEDAVLAWPEDSPEREQVRGAAVQALLAAGEAARARLALDEAARFADRALELARTDHERLAGLELRASALHAAVRSDEAFVAYRDALELASRLGDRDAHSRLRAHAALLCARYSGAFTDDSWKAPAVELVESGLEAVGEKSVSFETGALLVGRSAMGARWFDEPTGLEEKAEEDARRAIEISELVDSTYLLSHAVEALIEYAMRGGFCDAGELGERLVSVCESLPDRAEAHEGLVTAATSLSRAGRYERAREVARLATRESVRLSPHHATHAGAGEAMCLVPAGRFGELLEATARVEGVVREEGGRLCQMGALGLAGRALALYEHGEPEAANAALELLETTPPPRGLVPFRCQAIDTVRPLAGLERTRRAAESLGRATSSTGRLYELRLALQLSALAGDWPTVDGLVGEARELAPRTCAPTLGWIADWAEAVALASDGDGEHAVEQATRAARELEGYGEPYTASRLLVDLLPFLEPSLGTPLAEDVARRLDAMGAHASAAEAATMGQRVAR
jgi:DNA-binding SARP family transcriptional activator/class 3 adenylate cyclase/tetratricopeptide (TPR) repeat protein